MKTLLTIVAVLLLSGCANNAMYQDDFVSGRDNIDNASTDYLVNKYALLNHDFNDEYYKEQFFIWEELNKRHPTFKWDSVFKGFVEVGMTTDELIWVRGRPFKINRASYGDQWVYGINWARSYYYFDTAGILTSWN